MGSTADRSDPPNVSAAEPLTVPLRTQPRAASLTAGSRLRALVELTKPGITRMVLVTTAAGFYLASPRSVDWLRLAITLVGTGLVASAAGALNQWLERDADGLMIRTQRRPLPSGRLGRPQALAFAAALALAGLGLTGFAIGIAPALVVALSLVTYLLIYTPLKRRTWWATIIGAVPGGLPILAGWMAAGGGLDGAGLALFAILFLWQMPHFYALAWIYRDDYLRGGFRLLSADDPTGLRTARQAVAFALLLVPVSLLPTMFGVSGRAYLVGAFALGLTYAGLGLALLIRRNNRRAWRLFFASVVYLPTLLLLMVLDKLAV
jgi:protoheme IX farnesyltransferase